MSRNVQIDRLSRSLSDALDPERTLAWGRSALAVLVLACACATHRETAASLDSKSASNEEVSAKVDTEIHKVEGPGRVTTTTEEFADAPQEAASQEHPGWLSALQAVEAAGGKGQDQGQRAPPAPTGRVLTKRTVQIAEFGPITTDTHAKADSSAVGARTAILDGRMEQVKDSKPSLGIPALGLVLAGLAAAAVFTRTLWVQPLLRAVAGLWRR